MVRNFSGLNIVNVRFWRIVPGKTDVKEDQLTILAKSVEEAIALAQEMEEPARLRIIAAAIAFDGVDLWQRVVVEASETSALVSLT